LGDQDEAMKKKRAEQQRKVLVFTLVMGFLVAVGALGGLFIGLLLTGGSLESDPALPLGLSVLGLALSLVAVDRLTKKLLANWIV
jgi:hypothetical protein